MIESINSDRDFDAFRDDFVDYLAGRLGVSSPQARSFLGDWLSTFSADALHGESWVPRGGPTTLERVAPPPDAVETDESTNT